MTQNKTPIEEARDIYTSGDRLKQLAFIPDTSIHKAVAKHPNTPTDILWQLGAKYPVELLENPVFDLLLLENPNVLGDMSAHTLQSLLSVAPESLFELLSRNINEEVRRSVASNNNTPATILEKLASDGDRYVRKNVARNNNTPPDLLEKLATDLDPNIRINVGHNSNTPATILEKLRKDENDLVRINVTHSSIILARIIAKNSPNI